jgi:hypothetical protein
MHLGLWRIWKKMPEVEILAETYDSVTFQYRDRGHEFESQLLSDALDLIKIEFKHPSGRTYSVPGEAKIGWNWGYQVTAGDREKAEKRGGRVPRLNEDGLAKWFPNRTDTRQRQQRGAGK